MSGGGDTLSCTAAGLLKNGLPWGKLSSQMEDEGLLPKKHKPEGLCEGELACVREGGSGRVPR